MKANMPSVLFVLAMLASLASGQLQDLPSCGLHCIASAVLHSTCAPTDTPCLCANAALQEQAHQCVIASCTVREQLITRNITNAQCGIFSGRDRSWVPPMILFIVLAGVTFVLRLVSRLVCHMEFWWDDFLNLLAATSCVAYSSLCFVNGNLGLGTDVWAVPQENISKLLQLTYASFLIYNFCQATLRTSVLLFYIRIFGAGTWPRRIFWTTLIVSDTVSVGFFLFNVFQCTPIQHLWLQWDGGDEGHCISPNMVTFSGAIIDLFWTLLILVIPIPYVLRLNLPPHKKFAAIVMCAWGICTLAIMCYRFTTLKAYNGSNNATILGIGVALWSGLELDVALICACMPSIYPLFLRVIHLGRRPPPPPSKPHPMPSASIVTIGGTGGKPSYGRSKKKSGPWSLSDMTGLTPTTSHEDDTSTTGLRREIVELYERSAGSSGAV